MSRRAQPQPGWPLPGDAAAEVRLLAELLDAIPDRVGYVDRHRVSRYRNRAMQQFLGRPEDDRQGVPLPELLGPSHFAAVERYVDGAVAGETQSFERTIVSSSGDERRSETTYLPRVGPDGPDGFFVVVADTSRRAEGESTRARALIRTTLLEERARMAIAMHDDVLQRLFAVGLDLELVTGLPDEADRRVEAARAALQDCIEGLRLTIKELSRGGGPASPLGAVDTLVSNVAQPLGIEPTVEHRGSFDTMPDHLTEQLLTVLAEALDNVVCHANATELAVTLVAEGGEVVLTVADNGVGLGHSIRLAGDSPAAARSLGVMLNQAVRLGGTLTAVDNDPRGTVLTWRVPLPEAPARPPETRATPTLSPG
ncbi:MAG: PAS domain-containing protein [Nocardioidaceae bacterium]